MNRFEAVALALPGLMRIQRKQMGDARGHLSRLFCAEELEPFGWSGPVAQVNQTVTRLRGTVRGMHFQRAPWSETKLVHCLRGEVWDVAVDLRRDSPTFLSWHAERLGAENQHALLIPRGFAHGFQTLSDEAEMLYIHSAAYVPQAEGGLRPDDPKLGITWPLPIAAISARDQSHPTLSSGFEGFEGFAFE